MMYLAVREEDWELVDSLAAATNDTAFLMSARAGKLFTGTDTAAQRAFLQTDTLRPVQTTFTLLWVGAMDEARRMAEHLKTSSDAHARSHAPAFGAELDRIGGHWPGVDAPCWDDVPPDPSSVMEPICALIPFLHVPPEQLRRLRARVAAWDSTIATPWPDEPNVALKPHARVFFLGAIDSRLGDHAGALAAAQRLEAMPAPDRWRPSTDALPRLLRAQVALRQNRAEEALRHLDMDGPLPPPELLNPMFGRELERWWHAEALYQAGRDQDALRWYRNSFAGTPFEFNHHAFVQLRSGQLNERLKRPEDAAINYARFIRIWKDADPELQPLVQDAKNALARLATERTR